MLNRRITSLSPYEAQLSYSRAVLAGNLLFISGTTGYDPNNPQPQSTADQCDRAFQTISTALSEAGSSMADIVRVRYLVLDREEFWECQRVIEKWLSRVKPAATMMIVAGLLKEGMRIEIEVDAVVGGGMMVEEETESDDERMENEFKEVLVGGMSEAEIRETGGK